MYSDSRKAQRNSFAHHRAHLLFKRPEAKASDILVWNAGGEDSANPAQTLASQSLASQSLASLTQRVRAGLLGFAPAGVSAGA